MIVNVIVSLTSFTCIKYSDFSPFDIKYKLFWNLLSLMNMNIPLESLFTWRCTYPRFFWVFFFYFKYQSYFLPQLWYVWRNLVTSSSIMGKVGVSSPDQICELLLDQCIITACFTFYTLLWLFLHICIFLHSFYPVYFYCCAPSFSFALWGAVVQFYCTVYVVYL